MLRSTELYDASARLSSLARSHSAALVATNWSPNDGTVIQAAMRREQVLLEDHRRSVTQIAAVSEVLEETGAAIAYVESDVDALIRRMDAATEASPGWSKLLSSLGKLGDALDEACAREIRLICTPQQADTRSLAAFPHASLSEIHAQLSATASPEVLAILREFPDARLLPSSDGIVLAFGDIETAPAVATLVPGVGSSRPGDWAGYAARTQQIAQRVGAGVLWIDYSAPATVPAAVSSGPAAVGAARLREFQQELSHRIARRGGAPHMMVVGHSYGSVVAGMAAREGMRADSLVLVGSPGASVRHASELNLKGENPQVVATTSPHDPIGLIVNAGEGAHGPNPAHEGFGAEVWPAAGGHSGYFDDPVFLSRLEELSRR